MSSGESIRENDLSELHGATKALRSALTASLGDLLPPYADEVLNDLQDITEQEFADLTKIRILVDEAAGVMEMLPSIPVQWEPVARAALAVRLIDTLS